MKQRGAAMRSTFLAIEKLYGADAVHQVKQAMPFALREQVSGSLQLVTWFPIEVGAAVHVAIRDVLGKGSWNVSHKIGVEAARIDFTGIYRVFMRAVQYDTMLDRVERAWSHYNSQGEIRWIERTAGSAMGRVVGVTGFNLGIWNAIAGRAEGFILMSGAKAGSATVLEATPMHASIELLWLE